MAQQQFCLRWNNHQKNMIEVFSNLLANESFVDVTLACNGMLLKAHRMVLSACSSFFQDIFVNNPCKHPVIIMKDIKYSELKAILEFMYKGEVNVSQDQLSALLKTAESLKVKGLAEVSEQQEQNKTPQSDQNFSQQPSSLAPSSSNLKNRNSQPSHRDFPSKSNLIRSSQSPPQSPSRKRTRHPKLVHNVMPSPQNQMAEAQNYINQNPEFVEAPIPSETPDMSQQIGINEDIKPIHIKKSPHSPEIEELEQTDNFNLYPSYMDETGNSNQEIMDNSMPSGSKDMFNESNITTDDAEFNPNMDQSLSMPTTSGATRYSSLYGLYQEPQQNQSVENVNVDDVSTVRRNKWYRNEKMREALQSVQSGSYNINQAARYYGIPGKTLWRYAKKLNIDKRK